MSLKKQVKSGLTWTLIDKVVIQAANFLISIFIARILSPEDYGIIAILYIFLAVSDVLVDSGFGKALIQDNNPSKVDYATVFFSNLAISIVCYTIIYFLAPYIAKFYKIPELINLARTLGLILIVNSLVIIPNAICSIRLNFKITTISRLLGTCTGGATGLFMAYSGYGLWTLVLMPIVTSSIFALAQWLQVKWIPDFVFSLESFKRLFSFGYRLIVGALLDALVRNIGSILIGKYISPKSLGFYSKGNNFSTVASNSVISILYALMFPVFSQIKNDEKRLIINFRRSVRLTALLVFPLFILLSAIAKPLIILLLTEKWIMAGEIFQLLVLARMVNMIALVNAQVLLSIGRSDVTLRQDVIKLLVSSIAIAVSFSYGIYFIAIAELIATLVNYRVNTRASKKIFNYGTKEQLRDVLPFGLAALFSVLLAVLLGSYVSGNLERLSLMTFSFCLSYVFILEWSKHEEYLFLKNEFKTAIWGFRKIG